MSEEDTGGPSGQERRRWTEDFEVAGNQLIGRIQDLIAEGNVRRLIIKHEGRTILEIPLTAATVAGGLTVLMAPALAAIGAVAALVTRVQVSIVREGPPSQTPPPPTPPAPPDMPSS